MKVLTALLGYLSILLEYIDLYQGFQPHPKKDNFSMIPQQTEGGFSPLAPLFLPSMATSDAKDQGTLIEQSRITISV